MGRKNLEMDEEVIETNVVELIKIIQKNKEKINNYVKDQILKALYGYSEKINKKTKSNQTPNEITEKEKFIQYAIKKLEPIYTKVEKRENNSSNIGEKELIKKLENQLNEIKENKIKTHDYERNLKTLTNYSRQIDNIPESESLNRQKLKEIRKHMPYAFLDLYIKTTYAYIHDHENDDNVDILNKIFENLCTTKKKIETLDTRKACQFNKANLTIIIQDIISKAKSIYEIVDQKSYPTEQPNKKSERADEATNSTGQKTEHSKIYFYGFGNFLSIMSRGNKITKDEARNCLRKINQDLDQQIENAQLFLPLPHFLLNKIICKLNILSEKQNKISFSDEEICELKDMISNKTIAAKDVSKTVSHETEQINRFLDHLKEIEKKIEGMDGSNCDIQEYQHALKEEEKFVKSISSTNHDVVSERSLIINRIQGLQIVSSRNCLRKINDILRQHKIDVQEFSYPDTNSIIYRKLNSEIGSLVEFLKKIPPGNKYIDRSTHTLHGEIYEVLAVLEQRAKHNAAISRGLKKLEKIGKDVALISRSTIDVEAKLQKLNEYRKEMNSVCSFSEKVYAKKAQICSKIQNLEHDFYETENFKASAALKVTFDDHENQVLKFNDTKSSDLYQTIKKNLKEFLPCLREPTAHLLQDGVYEICGTLKKTAMENECTSKFFEDLNNIDIISEKVEALRNYKKLVNSVEIFTKKDEILDKIQIVEENTNTEKSKQDLIQIKENICQLNKLGSLSNCINCGTHKRKIDEIMCFKDNLEDMSEGHREIDEQKQFLLRQIRKILENFDNYVAQKVVYKKNSTRRRDLHIHFNYLESLVPEESVTFVETVKMKAAIFEDRIKEYCGAKTNIEYYVIDENLSRLLAKLDKESYRNNDHLLEVMLATINYIKELQVLLKANAADA